MGKSGGEKHAEFLEKQESKNLKPYALKSCERRQSLGDRFFQSRTRPYLEYRTEYHRDRDRILWSKSFKRLQHKTQIFPHYVQDHYRRRLTHSLEVAQIATTVARALGLNEIATEAIALGHDLGHPPFGHAGETALSKALKKYSEPILQDASAHEIPIPISGFDHCAHAVETVSFVEREYESETGTGGLNLTFDVRDGILKHMYDYTAPPPNRPLSIMSELMKFRIFQDYGNNKGSLEAQCVYFADKVAYLLGDMEDGLRSHILKCSELNKHELRRRLNAQHRQYRGNGTMRIAGDDDFTGFRSSALTVLILDCIENSLRNIESCGFESVEQVLSDGKRVIAVSSELAKAWDNFYDKWLRGYMFEHEDVTACTFKAEKIVSDLFDAYMDNPNLISKKYSEHCAKAYGPFRLKDSVLKLITARNYVAGMTDAFATTQHERLFMSSERAV